jgi:hypothetical protein
MNESQCSEPQPACLSHRTLKPDFYSQFLPADMQIAYHKGTFALIQRGIFLEMVWSAPEMESLNFEIQSFKVIFITANSAGRYWFNPV